MSGNEMNIYFIKRWFLRKYFKFIGSNPAKMNMVKYWKNQDHVRAKVTTMPDGSLGMWMEGEDEPFPGFPRSHMLFGNYRNTGHGPLSVLKHTIKNEIFNYAYYSLQKKGKNDVWEHLRLGKTPKEVIKHIKEVALPKIYEISEDLKYDLLPPEKMFGGVRELWRAMGVLQKRYPKNKHLEPLKRTLCMVFLDDDSYVMRLKWITQVFNPSSWWFKLFFRNPIKDLNIALEELEVAEVMGDMKERVRLLRAGVNLILEDKNIRKLFMELCKEVDWRKLKLSKADIYHLRAKFFKADLIRFEY